MIYDSRGLWLLVAAAANARLASWRRCVIRRSCVTNYKPITSRHLGSLAEYLSGLVRKERASEFQGVWRGLTSTTGAVVVVVVVVVSKHNVLACREVSLGDVGTGCNG